MSIEWEYQKAIFTALDAQKVTLGVVGVYDVAPQAQDGGNMGAFPYIVMGQTLLTQLDTQTRNGWTLTTRIHVFSRTGSMKECKEIQGGIYGILHRQPLSVTGFNAFEMLRNDTECFSMQDGRIHGLCEYIGLVDGAV